MPTSSIRVIGISTEEFDSKDQSKQKSSPTFRVHGRLNVNSQVDAFDLVRIDLRGAIKTRIGSKNAIEPLPSSTLVKSHLDFKPAYNASRNATEDQRLDFMMQLPSRSSRQEKSKDATNGSTNAFVPSLSLAASTYITRVTALKDRHLVEGSCQVVYWLEAELVQSGSERIVRKLSCPVDVSSLHVPLTVEAIDETSVEQVIKPKSRRLSRVFSSVPEPQVSVKMPRQLGTMSSASAKFATGSRHLSVPVTVTLDLPAGTSHQTLTSLETNTLQCSIRTHWYTSRTFGTSSLSHFEGKQLNPGTVIRNTTLSGQKLELNFPPLYNSTTDGNSSTSKKFSTSTMIDLILPESISSPTVSTELLDIGYCLDMSMKFAFDTNDSIMRPCTADFHLPVTLSAAQPTIMLNLQRSAPLAGLVEQGLVVAPPPYIS
ncbi:hypothetical protein LTR84_000908 [Exophiala bonariae]|uniref:Arrestin-like N-terminal domain-containing protein n=1 Tax=Exophiala bonariae TaxID=1690606 RepID=A0AAV9NW07_9EURO|nr:hypothetical protein LTR84_000908 [Exophiala bonariae]